MGFNLGEYSRHEAAIGTIYTTGDKLVFDPPQPVMVVEFGFIVTTSFAGVTSQIWIAETRPVAGSSSNAVQVGTITLGSGVNPVAGKVIQYRFEGLPQSQAYQPTTGLPTSTLLQTPVKVIPGSEFAVKTGTTTGTSAGSGYAYCLYRPVGQADLTTSSLTGVDDMVNVTRYMS